MTKKTLMIVGLGNLATHVLDMLCQSKVNLRIIVASKNTEYVFRRLNLSRLTAIQRGYNPEIFGVYLDLNNIEQSSETLMQYKPDIIFNTATIQSWRIITQLPQNIFEDLDKAGFGPWIPMHLPLVKNLMLAVKHAHLNARVINAAFPDLVNYVLGKVNLAPDIGIGNVANLVPALRLSAGVLLNTDHSEISVKFIAHHFISHYVPRFGYPKKPDFDLSIFHKDHDVTKKIDLKALFDNIPTQFKRVGGTEGQILTAASAMSIILSMLNSSLSAVHAPGPLGLPGGYPLRVSFDRIELDLPENITLENAINLNLLGQLSDGVDNVTDNGDIYFTDESNEIMSSILGYRCKKLSISDCVENAKELKDRFQSIIKNEGAVV